MKSILHRASRADVVHDPFPHLVLEEALEPELYEQLAREFPAAEIVLDGRRPESNRYYRYAAHDVLGDSRISPRWREFMTCHTSRSFYAEVIALFGDSIRQLHPTLEPRLGKKLEELDTGVRFADGARDISLECQFTYNAPVTETSRSIGPHIDRPVSLFAALLYFRLDEDDSTGGELELYRLKGSRPVFARDSQRVPDHLVETRATVPYGKNNLIFFLQSRDSLHGVTPRSATALPRIYINSVGELPFEAFDIAPYRDPSLSI